MKKKKVKKKILKSKVTKRRSSKIVRRKPLRKNPHGIRFSPDEIENIRIYASPRFQSAVHFISAYNQQKQEWDYDIFLLVILESLKEDNLEMNWADEVTREKILEIYSYLKHHPELLKTEKGYLLLQRLNQYF